MHADLLLRGGRICDGTGAPAYSGDVAVRDGDIVAVGRFGGLARRVIDVSDLIVAPGFIDVHTHYDAQITWDGLCTPSCWHGVTSVVLGNCGFALAPCRPGERERLLRMLEFVEGMPYASLYAGVTWEWESIPQYLLMIAQRPLGLNVAALIGHSALRAYVLGAAAYERAATEDEIARMQDLVREAMAAGAVGLATSLSSGHVGEAGRPVPSRQATREELHALATAMADSGHGIVEITPHTFPISSAELAALQALARSTGRPVSFSAILDLPERDGVWEPVFEQLRAGTRQGAVVAPQVSCRPMRFDFDLETGCASLDALPCWRRFRAAASRQQRLIILADPEFRNVLRAQALGRPEAPSSRRWQTVILEDTACSADQRFLGQPLADVVAARGGDVIDALLDLAAADDLRARFSLLLLNYDDERVGHLLRQPESLIALSDAGAHVSVLCDAGYATYLLGHWVRERRLFSWEEAVYRLTGMPAALYSIPRRGRLAPGCVADLTCFDPARVAMLPPQRVCDFPGGVSRYIARATGIEHVFIAGQELIARGEWTGAHPGTLLRP